MSKKLLVKKRDNFDYFVVFVVVFPEYFSVTWLSWDFVDQGDLKLKRSHLSQPLKCGDQRCPPPYPA